MFYHLPLGLELHHPCISGLLVQQLLILVFIFYLGTCGIQVEYFKSIWVGLLTSLATVKSIGYGQNKNWVTTHLKQVLSIVLISKISMTILDLIFKQDNNPVFL